MSKFTYAALRTGIHNRDHGLIVWDQFAQDTLTSHRVMTTREFEAERDFKKRIESLTVEEKQALLQQLEA